jgi:hypothetical protein
MYYNRLINLIRNKTPSIEMPGDLPAKPTKQWF